MAKKQFTLNKGKETQSGTGGESSSHGSSTVSTVAEAEQETLPLREREERQKVARLIPIERIRPNPYQKRLYFEEEKIQDLASGMQEHGWIGGGLPVRSDPEEANTYQLVWGERRWRAAKLAELTAIPCEISIYSDDEMTELGLLENVQRENLTNYELGMAYKSLLELKVDGKPKYSIRTLAKTLGFRDKSAVERMLVYARAPEDVQEMAKTMPDVAPRIVHELTHMKEEDRAPVIAAVLAGESDIEDVRAVRKQLSSFAVQEAQGTSEASAELPASHHVEVGQPPVEPRPSPLTDEHPLQEQAPGGAVVVKEQSPTPQPMQAERALVERRMKRDNGRIIEILTQWSDARGTLDDATGPALLDFLTTWETAIVQLKQLLQPVEE